jgi:hypothetical protein
VILLRVTSFPPLLTTLLLFILRIRRLIRFFYGTLVPYFGLLLLNFAIPSSAETSSKLVGVR